MTEAKVYVTSIISVGLQLTCRSWEPLEEPAPEGQWSYFERMTHTKTQKP